MTRLRKTHTCDTVTWLDGLQTI